MPKIPLDEVYDLNLVRLIRVTSKDEMVLELCSRFEALVAHKSRQKSERRLKKNEYMRKYMRRRRQRQKEG